MHTILELKKKNFESENSRNEICNDLKIVVTSSEVTLTVNTTVQVGSCQSNLSTSILALLVLTSIPTPTHFQTSHQTDRPVSRYLKAAEDQPQELHQVSVLRAPRLIGQSPQILTQLIEVKLLPSLIG